ncbi:MAG: aminopeptidase P N-terminal domain-containing protein, partial [Candidatus Eremiobacteraeota bacterium]|nr:aminopeptidase P N-terminal domain-containing protein [Candidatus Eremiobacteraeota bacterium]
MKPFSDRRATFAKALGTGVAVIPGARLSLRNRDTEYEFRQSSDFYYLTGFTEPDAVLVMVCADGSPRSILFTLPRDRAIEVWTGKRHGIEGAIAQFGFDEAFEIKELDTRLPELLHGHDTLFYSIGGDEALDRRVL